MEILVIAVLVIAVCMGWGSGPVKSPVEKKSNIEYERALADYKRFIARVEMDRLHAEGAYDKWVQEQAIAPIVTEPIVEVVEDIEQEEEPEMVYKNISTYKEPLHWFECDHPNLPKPSPAERKLIRILAAYKCKWYREVSFYGLQVNTYSYPRYDFWIPAYNIILEYDGQGYHNSNERKAMDKLKNQYCKQHGIRIVRYNKRHWYTLDTEVATLMAEYGIRLRK